MYLHRNQKHGSAPLATAVVAAVAALSLVAAGCGSTRAVAKDAAGGSTHELSAPSAGIASSSALASPASDAVPLPLPAVADVDMAALQATLDQWDGEDEMPPFITVSESGGAWALTYGAASKQAGTRLNASFPNAFDAINAAIAVLPRGRTEKYKVRVESDVHAGESATSNGASIINNLYSIGMQSYTVLDFAGHTLYADSADARGLVPIAATRVSNFSLRNLVMRGHARYAIWVQGCENAVFDNIAMHMDEKSGLGLRIAERSTTWSRNIYVDNIVATGMRDNAVETMKVDGIWIGTIEATDCNDCGLLLNTTTNAVVGVVKGVRCSPRNDKGIYAAMRCANFVGPNVHVHRIDAEECGHAFFSVSANHGIVIDEIESVNSWAQPILVQDTQELLIKRGRLTAGSHNKSKAVEFAAGSAGGALRVMNNCFQNIEIVGYDYGFVDHAAGVSDFSSFSGCTFTGVAKPYELTGAHNNIDASAADTATAAVSIKGRTVSDSAYKGYTALRSVTIPASVKEIGAAAFYGCTSLESVTIKGACTIGADAFYGCTALKTLVINGKVTEIGDCAFGNTALTEVSLPDSVAVFGHNLFSPATKRVTIASTAIQTMKTEAFFNLAAGSVISFTGAKLEPSRLYHLEKGTPVFGDWGAFWYGFTRSTVE